MGVCVCVCLSFYVCVFVCLDVRWPPGIRGSPTAQHYRYLNMPVVIINSVSGCYNLDGIMIDVVVVVAMTQFEG